MLMRGRVSQCSRVAHCCVFNSFCTTMDVNDSEEYAVSGFVYTHKSCEWDQLIVGFGLFVRFVDKK